MRVITFSRQFPVKHPKAGQPTFFVEKIWDSIYLMDDNADWLQGKYELRELFDLGRHGEYGEKNHTIRAGNRWKVGDWFSPRVWSGKPYASKQIEFAPPIQIKKIWNVRIEIADGTCFTFYINGKNITTDKVVEISTNDGLEIGDFFNWFSIHSKKIFDVFEGQILCWNESINY